MSDKFKFIMPGNPQHICAVRMAIGSLASNAGFDLEEIEDIKTAAGEACQLIFCHEMEGYAREYTVECETDPEEISIRVINTSDDMVEKTNRKCLDCPNEGELGMIMIRTLMDEVNILCDENNRKTISMTKVKK